MTDGLSPNRSISRLGDDCDLGGSQAAQGGGGGRHRSGCGRARFSDAADSGRAGIRAIKDGKTHYSANEGFSSCGPRRRRISALLSGGRPVNADHIVVSNGSKQRSSTLLHALRPGRCRRDSAPPGCRIRNRAPGAAPDGDDPRDPEVEPQGEREGPRTHVARATG